MKNKLVILGMFVLGFINLYAQRGRKLVWSEEFNYSGLPDSTKWNYEEGYIRNEEKQYYTKARLENIEVHNGLLEIKGKKENYVNRQFVPGSQGWKTADSLAQYTSASIITLGKVSWKYGRIEVKAKIPSGKGVWPAIWMMGANHNEAGWPLCGEIDIMEFVGKDSNHVYGTIHYPKKDSVSHSSSGGSIEVQHPFDDFHVYALEWNRRQMKIWMDDKCYHTFQLKDADINGWNPFRKPFYLQLNLALGGAWGGPVDDANLPQSFLVDYVRIYR